MRLQFYLEPKENKIPKSNRFMITSLIKKSIENSDKELFNEIYFFDNDKKNKKIKDFAFSVYLEDFELKEDFIFVKRVKVIVTTANYNVGIAICNGIMSMKKFEYKNEYSLAVSSVKLLQEKNITKNDVVLKTLSGIHIKDKENRPVDINSENFEKELNYIANLYLKVYRGYGLLKELKFEPISMKKVVVKEEIEGFKKSSGKNIMFINSYVGIFKLSGISEDLNILIQSGIGFRRSQGYGAVEIL